MPFTETCRMEERVRMLSDFDSGAWSVSQLSLSQRVTLSVFSCC
jgi:hypothetical protein